MDHLPHVTAPVIEAEVEELAAEVGLPPVALQGAVNTVKAPPRQYLIHEGHLAPPAPARPVAPAVASVAPGGTVWDRLAQCESNGRWNIATGNGFYGGLQFLPSTWRANGGSGMPHQASRAEQIRVAQIVQARYGWGQWPACSRRLGLR